MITGATRPENKTARAVKLVQNYLKEKYPQISLTTVNPNDFTLDFDNHDQNPEYLKLVSEANALIILTPEYNHGYPGKLKSLLDCAFKEYKDKHVLLGGVSDGPFGGARAIENLSPIIKCFSMIMSKADMIFPTIDKIIDADGKSLDAEHYSRVTKVIDEFIVRVS